MWQLSPEQRGNHHRSALSASWAATKSHGQSASFQKRRQFLYDISGQPANTKVVGQMAYKFSTK